MPSLLAQHAPDDRVAFGVLGARTAADLLCHAGAVARALPDASPGSLVLIGVRRDRYAFAAALLGAWARGRDVLLPAVDVSREAFLALAQQPGVSAVLHDTLSSAALPIARVLADARPEHALTLAALEGESVIHLFGRSGQSGQPRCSLRRSQLLTEAAGIAAALQLPERARCYGTTLPETRYALTASVLWPLLSGGALWRDDPRALDWQAQLLAHAAPGGGARVLVSVPAHLRALARSASAPLSHMERVLSGAAPLPRAAFDAIGPRVTDLYASEDGGALGQRSTPDADFAALPDAPWSTAADGGGGQAAALQLQAAGPGAFRAATRWSEREERVAWIEGVRDAALLPPDRRAPIGACWLAVVTELACDEPTMRARIAAAVPELAIAELLLVQPHTAPADPAGVASFTGGLRGLRRDGAGRHDRTGLLRLFGLSPLGRPLSHVLRVGASSERDGKHVTEIGVPEDYVYFAGHFPGYPILPGAAQLSEMVLPCARRARPGLGRLVRMARLKFQERIMPGDQIEVVLAFPADPKQVDFSLMRAGTVCAAGRLSFELDTAQEGA